MADTPETKVKAAIKKYLLRIDGGYFFSVPASRFSTHGIPDILGSYRGWFVALEVKSPEAYHKPQHNLSVHQQRFLQQLELTGAVAACVCSVDQVRELIEGLESL